MYRRACELVRERFGQIALRMNEDSIFSLGRLPAVATHLGCFLAGSLLFEPDSRGVAPPEILIPLSGMKIEGGIHIGSVYRIVSDAKPCRLFAEDFRLWRPEEKKVFLRVKPKKLAAEVMASLHGSEVRIERVKEVNTESKIAICPRSDARLHDSAITVVP